MRICGISFEPKAAVVALVDFVEGQAAAHVDTETRRISLNDHEDGDCLRSFQQTVRAFLTDNSVDVVSIRRCTYSGKYQSGAPPLKMEALLQVLEIETFLIPVQTITGNFQDGEIEMPDSLRAYQHDAFKTAWAHNILAMGN
jgi:hypothetical protein